MMNSGLQNALNEITLVFFTTLAPSGVLAIIILAFLLIRNPVDFDRKKVHLALCFPLVITTVGLIASATHLGNPANALYVFTGVGRSPLSNEVFFAVVFLLLAGVYWLYSFSLKPRVKLQNIWLVFIIISGVVFITTIAFAYATPTIISWDTAFAPINIWLNAFVGGPVVALFTLQLAKLTKGPSRFGKSLLLMSAVALVANIVSLVAQTVYLSDVENAFVTVRDLVPFNEFTIVLYVVCTVGALLIYAIPFRKGSVPSVPKGALSCFLVYLGIFATRFTFYAMHMTVGLTA